MRGATVAGLAPEREALRRARSKCAPRSLSRRMAAGRRVASASRPRMARPSRRPRPRCRARAAAGESSGPSAAAMPPCAQGVDPPGRGAPWCMTVAEPSEPEGGRQPGDARADHDRVTVPHVARWAPRSGDLAPRADVEHPIDRARARARPPSGSISTSCCMCCRARRMLRSVMRFMCGHRLHGRTNSTWPGTRPPRCRTSSTR